MSLNVNAKDLVADQRKIASDWFNENISPMIRKANQEFMCAVEFSWPKKWGVEEKVFANILWEMIEKAGFTITYIGELAKPKRGHNKEGMMIEWFYAEEAMEIVMQWINKNT